MKILLNNFNSTKGFSLVEILIAIVVSLIILAAVTSLYLTSDKVLSLTKKVADTKETAKHGMAGLEWIMQRWGTSTPCNDPTGNNNCLPVIDCRVQIGQNLSYIYPPPSSMCITITDSTPCDEVVFYGNLYGNGFVERFASPTTVALMSCRLSSENNQNCYHLKRGGLFVRDFQNNANVLIFSLSNLGANNLDCVEVTSTSNTNASRTVTALNGNVADQNNNPTQFMNLESGDLLLRVPHRIRLFCQNNPQDNNRRWLYMEGTDMSSNCQANEIPQPIVPVNTFDVVTVSNGVKVTIEATGPDGRVMQMQRYFGR